MSTEKKLKEENALLKAEVGLLKHKLGRLLGAEQEWELVQPGEYARLKAEVERLSESGSSIVSILCQHVSDSNLRNLALREWKAAKEGKPTK